VNDRVTIFDTTLRDGEQSPGCSMNMQEKMRMVQQFEKLRVDVIEAGFPISSNGDFEAVKKIADTVEYASVAALCRTVQKDIDRGWEAIRDAQKPCIHTFIATSDIHLKYKLNKSRDEVIRDAVRAVAYARSLCDRVEFSCEDASRSDIAYLTEIVHAAVEAGATVINLPDTVGYALPDEYGSMFRTLLEKVPGLRNVTLSAHCHNDLGLAVANSLAAVRNGARQVECTINGIGERAGNASLEEFVMAVKTRREELGFDTDIATEEIYKTSRLLSTLTGMVVQRNKAIVGANAFAHEAGIHQDGMLKSPLTYEIMTPQSVGIKKNKLVLGKHSGRHALKDRYKQLGYALTPEELNAAYSRFCDIADNKKVVFDEDLIALVEDNLTRTESTYELLLIQVNSGTQLKPTATIEMRCNGAVCIDSATGDGPVDAAYKAVERITGMQVNLEEYTIKSVSSGRDALAEVFVSIEFDGTTYNGRAVNTDVITGSVRAYIDALNRAHNANQRKSKGREEPAPVDVDGIERKEYVYGNDAH
jgi:2-isopropylmalate synthase